MSTLDANLGGVGVSSRPSVILRNGLSDSVINDYRNQAKDPRMAIVLSALQNYRKKEIGKRMKYDVDLLIFQMIVFMDWEDVISNNYERIYKSYERREYILHALEIYEKESELRNQIIIRQMIEDLKLWLSNWK